MDAKELFLKISQNDENFGQCSADTAANVLNNEEILDKPATYFMYEPKQDDIDINGSIKIKGTRKMLESGSYDGAGATLANARLYAFFKPIQNELFEKESEYKKFVFDNSNFFYRFGKDYMRNWYSLKKNEAVYKMAKAQQDGDFTSALDYKYQIEDLDKKIAGYVQPEEGLANSSANVIASMARNAPELLAVSLGAAAVTYITGGTGTAAFLSSVGSTALNGAIIYNDTYKLEAGEILQNLEGSDLTLEQKLAAADEYATPAALIEASGALFGLTKMGTSAITKGALSLTEKGAARLQRKGVEKFVKETTKKKLLEELLKRPIAQKIKDPKYIAYFGKKVAEHVLAATGEGAQEVTQEILQDAIINAVNSGEDPENIDVINNIFKVLKDGSNSSKYGQLFLNTVGASLLISGTGATTTTIAQTGTQKLIARSMQNMNTDKVSERIMEQKRNSTAYNKSPKAYSENTAEITNAGNAPETVAMNSNNLMEVLDDAEKTGNTNVLQKLDELGITREKLESSISGTGVMKIDFNQFDNVVLDPNDDSLFQKVKGEYTFDETTLTKKEMEVLLNDIVSKRPNLAPAIEDKDSAFNIVLSGLLKNKNFTHKQALNNAVLAQHRMDMMMTFRGEKGKPISFDILNRLEKELEPKIQSAQEFVEKNETPSLEIDENVKYEDFKSFAVRTKNPISKYLFGRIRNSLKENNADYNKVGEILRTELEKEGLDSNDYMDAVDFIIGASNKLFQKQQERIAGSFSKEFGKYIIKLTEAANPTTFQHEFTHMTMTEMLDAYNSGEMTEYWQKKTEVIASFAGFEKDKNGKYIVESSNKKMAAKIVAAHEKVADAFNTYLKEGKAPVESLADVFHQMMEWFIDVYRMLKMRNVKLNKSIRNAFDSLLVSKEEMDQAIIDKNLRAIGRRPGVSESDYQQYLSDLTKLNRVSTNKHLEAIRKKQRIAVEEKNKQKFDEIRKNVDAQISQDPRYMLVDDIRVRKINSGDIPSGMKLKNPQAFSREDGIPAEQFITDHEDVVSNIADIVELLNNLEDKSELVERQAQEQFSEWLNEEYPELADVEAKAAATNIELIKVRLKEYMMLMGIPMSQFNQYYNELVRAGNSEIEGMKLRELTNVERLLDLETRIVTKARIAKTDKELANALWHQAAIDYIIMRAKDIRVQVKRFNRHFDKYRYLPHASDFKRIDAYDFDMITGILRNLGFTKKRPRVRDIPLSSRLTEWINNKMNSSFSDAEEIRDYIPSLSNDIGVKFDNNTYHDFAVFDVLTRLIESISKSDKELTEVNKQELREKDVLETVEYQQNKGINPSSMNWWTDLMVMKEQFLKKILPTRKFLDYVAPFVQGIVLREQRIARNDELIADALNDTIKNSKQIFSVNLASGGIMNMTYADMQVAVLNIDNMETWIESWNAQKNDELTKDDFMSIIEAAPEKMLIDAKKIWDVFESQREDFRNAQYQTNGFLMDYVEPRSITLSDGRTIQSGYYPRGKMPSNQADFGSVIMSFENNGVYTMATSKFAKDRKENIKHKELDLTINSLRSWLYHTATVIEIGPKFNKLSKFLNNEIMAAQLGKETVKSLNDWMSYSVVGDNLNKFYATLDKISSVQILGWEPIRAAVQAFGWIPSMSTIGPQWIAPQFLKVSSYSNLLPFKIETAAKLSPYMRMRYENAVNHIAGMSESNQLIRTGKTLADKIMNVAMWFTAHGDAFSSYIVWNAAFEKATAEGYNHDDAVLMADSAVRTSQGDSTGVSRPKILQGDKRVITKFASYFIAMNSRISSAIVGKDRAELVAMMMLSGIVAPVVEAYLRSGYEWFVGSDDDKKKWRKLRLNSFEDVALYNMKQNVLSTIGQTAMPIAGLGGYVGNLLATGNTYDKPLPMIDYLYSIGKTVSYPALAVTAETEREKQKYIKGFEKSLLKSLTMPNKFIRMLTE